MSYKRMNLYEKQRGQHPIADFREDAVVSAMISNVETRLGLPLVNLYKRQKDHLAYCADSFSVVNL